MSEEQPLDGYRHHYHNLKEFPGSFCLISRSEEANTAVIFVHGFGGDACGTWADFHQLVDDLDSIQEWFGNADLYFFQYKSVWERIDSSVERLTEFIDTFIPVPETKPFTVNLQPVLPEERSDPVVLSALPASRKYKRAFLVGHSEGGVVIRKVVVNAAKDERSQRPDLLSARVALFAPALFGYCPSGFLGTLSNLPGIGQVVDAFFRASPAYQDLTDVNDLLRPLQEDTEGLAAKFSFSALRASILWSRRDYVVKPGKDGKYQHDFRKYIAGSSHTAICKPRLGYTEPLTLIMSLEKLFP